MPPSLDQLLTKGKSFFSYLCKSFSRFFLGDIALGNELLEWREKKPEQGNMLPKQASCSNATWVERGEGDASVLVVSAVELLHGEHVAYLAVLVCLGTVKSSTINHG